MAFSSNDLRHQSTQYMNFTHKTCGASHKEDEIRSDNNTRSVVIAYVRHVRVCH